jgi:hypothetical protein
MSFRRAGRMHHLGTGATHARTRVLAIADGATVTVIALETGEILSTHTIDPTKTYWRSQQRRSPTHPADHHRRTPSPDRPVPQQLQPHPPAPIPTPPGNTSNRLQRPAESNPGTDRSNEIPYHVLHDIVDKDGKLTLRLNGRLHHIGIGTENRRTPVLKIIDDHHVRIVNAATGELLRELTINPDHDYQPLGRPPGPAPRTKKPEPS